MQKEFFIIGGTTASGKSDYAHSLLNENKKSIIINADSQQVYKNLPILCANPEFHKNYFLYSYIDYLNHDEQYSLFKWIEDVENVIRQNDDIERFIFVGGSGFYINALLSGINVIPHIEDEIKNFVEQLSNEETLKKFLYYDLNAKLPHISFQDIYRQKRALCLWMAHKKIASDFPKKEIIFDANLRLKIIMPEKNVILQKVSVRINHMLECGLLDEIKAFIDSNIEEKKCCILGFNTWKNHVLRLMNLECAKQIYTQQTMQYIKRQKTWFNAIYKDYKHILVNF
jgi:tRNA dimethylallyltransferase